MESLAAILLVLLLLALLSAWGRGGLPTVGKWLHSKFVGAS